MWPNAITVADMATIVAVGIAAAVSAAAATQARRDAVDADRDDDNDVASLQHAHCPAFLPFA